MRIVDYRFLSIDDTPNTEFNSWSRIYEYQYCLDFIKSNMGSNCSIHNSAWGTDDKTKWASCDDHVLFRKKLDELGECVHSDKFKSLKLHTYIYDITKPNKEYKEKFDFVLNVSVIEHLSNGTQLQTIKNLYDQVKVGGYLICTFDYPRVNTNVFKEFIGANPKRGERLLNGSNSKKPNKRYNNLNVIGLILQKN